MKVYAKEIEAGLEDLLKSTASIAYASALTPCKPQVRQFLSKASEFDNDVFYAQAILVSTNMNKNTDLFSPQETWAARYTPTHKPMNLDHDELKIVGHITDGLAIDDENQIIDFNTTADSLPDLYHLVIGCVVYRAFQDEGYKNRAEKLIAQIESGEKFVSMECLFADFDYALVKDDSYKVVARNENTSFLTKYLRAYGGTGEYEGYKLGRLLKNFRFTACGFVDRPANPNSVILQRSEHFNFAKAKKVDVFEEKGVLSNEDESNKLREIVMANENDKVIDELKAELKATQKELAEAREKSTKAGFDQLTSEKADLENKLAAAKDEIKNKIDEVNTKANEVKELTKKLVEAEAKRDEYKADLDKAAAEKVVADRVAKLVEGGFDKEAATEKVAKFAALSTEQFDEVANELLVAKKMMSDKEMKKEMEDKNKKDKKGKAEDALEDIEVVNELELNTASEQENKALELRKAIAEKLSIKNRRK